MLQRLAWTAMVTVMSTVAARLAYKAAEKVWKAAAKSDPPKTGRLEKLLLGAPLARGTNNLTQRLVS